ncbi:hypothetical protein [Nostoc sp.]|uniref:hypothetical protein n=1 Tax=Nostoc sp. TaxID=1180 RepID=UPI002FF67EC0
MSETQLRVKAQSGELAIALQTIYGSLQRSPDVFVHNRRRLVLVLHVAGKLSVKLQLGGVFFGDLLPLRRG